MNRRIPVAITIAGSDSGGGAGIEADLKTFAALGVHGTVAITSVTAQNTYEVTAIHDIPPEIVYKQIEAIAVDMGIDAGKTGMLSNSEIIRAVAKAVRNFGFPLVVDPVMIAKSGAKLLRDEAIETLIKELLPLAKVVTPNAPEATRLTGIHVRDLDTAKQAARKLVEEYSVEAAIVKGGHISGDESVDVMYWNGNYYYFRAPRIRGGCTHGTGCSFSAAIAAGLAKRLDIYNAVKIAKELITVAIDYGLRIGKGHCPVNPMAWLYLPAYRYEVINELSYAVKEIMSISDRIYEYVPEVGMNIVMSLPYPYTRNINDVAGVKGRIVKYGSTIKPVGPIEFGASSHMARLVLEAMKYDHTIRSALNLRYSKELVEKAEKAGLRVVFIDRRDEPAEIKRIEGGTMQWLVKKAVELTGGQVPDVIYDVGDLGKEPMFRVLGKSAIEVVEKVKKIIGYTR
ncbi:MAG: bifunctional hydroxymethylpyrimidine kinase/phosphomethylpyrimidine kinase [Thermoprotei archaeon]